MSSQSRAFMLISILSALIYLMTGLVESNPTLVRVPSNGNTNNNHYQTNVAQDTLSLLFFIHRHGDRAPIDFAPKDPYMPLASVVWPTGLGMLTNEGKERMYKLGQYLRRRYANYLDTSNPRQIFSRSSDVDRCIASAQLVLAGLYPPVGESIWNSDLLWQPMPIHTRPQHDDPMLNVESHCPTREKETGMLFGSDDTKKSLLQTQSDAAEITARLKSEYGYKFDTVFDYYSASSTFNIEKQYNLTLPQWILEDLSKLDSIAYHSEQLWTKSDSMKRLYAGVVIGDIVDKMQEHQKQQQNEQSSGANWARKKTYKVYHYSTHDTNIHSILNTLGVYQGLPPFGATIMIELHQTKLATTNSPATTASNGIQQDNYLVKLFFLRDTKEEDKSLKELTPPGCQQNGQPVCSLDMFADYTRKYRLTPSEWISECNR